MLPSLAAKLAGMSQLVAVVGPTATGKSALAVALAQHLGGEVVNADSMQLYHGMDIGTAKLRPAQRGGVPHHLLDIWEVTEPASIAAYAGLARPLLDRLAGAATTPIVVGGSGLYVRAALGDLAPPPTDPELRADLETELVSRGPAALHQRLARLDPAAAAAVLPSNGRRIVRALEVIALTGGPFAAQLPGHSPKPGLRMLGIDLPTAELDARVADRVARMWRDGLVDEVRELVSRGLRAGRTARRALGYAQVLRLLDGELTDAQAREQTVRATRRFIRRQRSWFRRDPRISWLDGAASDLPARALAALG